MTIIYRDFDASCKLSTIARYMLDPDLAQSATREE
jgi:hypothetical protein